MRAQFHTTVMTEDRLMKPSVEESPFQYSVIRLPADRSWHHDPLEEDTVEAVYQNSLENRLNTVRLKSN